MSKTSKIQENKKRKLDITSQTNRLIDYFQEYFTTHLATKAENLTMSVPLTYKKETTVHVSISKCRQPPHSSVYTHSCTELLTKRHSHAAFKDDHTLMLQGICAFTHIVYNETPSPEVGYRQIITI